MSTRLYSGAALGALRLRRAGSLAALAFKIGTQQSILHEVKLDSTNTIRLPIGRSDSGKEGWGAKQHENTLVRRRGDQYHLKVL